MNEYEATIHPGIPRFQSWEVSTSHIRVQSTCLPEKELTATLIPETFKDFLQIIYHIFDW